jgi:uncharacterized protein (TIGR02599 family)
MEECSMGARGLKNGRLRRGFTLVELMAAVTVLVILLGIIMAVMNSVSLTVRRSSAKIDAFAAARSGFNLMNQKLSQATLNTYWDYDNPLNPTVYRRQSDLQFLILSNSQNPNYGQEVYFQSPQAYADDASLRSTDGLLNACGFFVAYGSDEAFRPATEQGKPNRYRYRLMQALQPTEKLSVYNAAPPTGTQSVVEAYWTTFWTAHAWINAIQNPSGSNSGYVAPLADNVIAVVVWPRLPKGEDPEGDDLTADYRYDSKLNQFNSPQPKTANQLPPVLQVTLVTISEASAVRLDTRGATPPALIEAALQGKFSSVAAWEDDLKDLGKKLADGRIEFDSFTTTIPLRESKWSED